MLDLIERLAVSVYELLGLAAGSRHSKRTQIVRARR
jgi:hypothetical protein